MTMTAGLLGLDKYPLRTFPYTDSAVAFDLTNNEEKNFGNVTLRSNSLNADELQMIIGSPRTQNKDEWGIDVRPLVSTQKWLLTHGLKRNKLDLFSILPRIGFPRSEKYEDSLKKSVISQYAYGKFNQVKRPDGKTFKIVCNKEKLKEIEERLIKSVLLFKRRLHWLTTESRRLFGVILEHCVCIVLDVKNMSPQQFDSFRFAAELVIRQQVAQLAKFNIIRAAEDTVSFSLKAVPVTEEAIDAAVEWLWKLDRIASVTRTATCEAVLAALEDKTVECIYLFSEGCSSDGSREILKEKLGTSPTPMHVVSFNCKDAETIKFLKDLSSLTGGRFHSYGLVMEIDTYEGLPPDPDTNKAAILHKRKKFGGVPPGVECREDVLLLFDELEEARNSLLQLQAILRDAPSTETYKPSNVLTKTEDDEASHEEHYMSSKEWLAFNGLRARHLGFYDVLSCVAFKHCDGVVDIKDRPPPDSDQRDAVKREKLVNALYCDKFAHVPWKDGRIVHVQITPDIHRMYEQRMIVVLNQIKTRIEWLQQGSRALFGTVVEDQVYVVVDTSASMEPSFQFVREKLYLLMQEQIRHKLKFNLISFSSKVRAWRDRLVDVNEMNLQDAWSWIKGLKCAGSTNTLGALKYALNDPATQAIYLLTDGRPDQSPKTVLSQVHLRESVPIHAISFNCADAEANTFLCQLARNTCGRYHYYSEQGYDPEGPEPWESEDIRLLKDELITGEQNLARISNLRDECTSLAWSKDTSFTKRSKKSHRSSSSSTVANLPPARKDLPLPSYSMKEPRKSITHADHRHKIEKPQFRYSAPNRVKRSLVPSSSHSHSVSAPHTKSSLLRAMCITGKIGRIGDEWLLPETRAILERQSIRQKNLVDEHVRKVETPRKIEKKKPNSSLSSHQWLRTNGLSAHKLTMMDVLGPTIVPHNPTYVPIIDKNVLAKVFDEVLPIAHVNKRKEVRLVNPDAIDLLTYEKRLEKAIDVYHKRLSDVVGKALPEAERQRFQFPLDWPNNRAEVMSVLERCGWPLRRSDISMLEEEIEQAEKYLEQSHQLRSNHWSSQHLNDDANSATVDKQDGAESPRATKETKEVTRQERTSGSVTSEESTASPVSDLDDTASQASTIVSNKDDDFFS